MPVFVVQAQGLDAASLERARFVPEKFSWPAFILVYFWLLYHRLWLALAAWIVLEIMFAVLVFPHVGIATALLVDVTARLFLGFEGSRLRLAKGEKRTKLTDIVEARDRDEAEASFFRSHAASAAEPAVSPPVAHVMALGEIAPREKVLGETALSRASDEVAPDEPKA